MNCTHHKTKSAYFLGRSDKSISINQDSKILIVTLDNSSIEDRNLVYDVYEAMNGLGFQVYTKTLKADYLMFVSTSESTTKQTGVRPVTNYSTTKGKLNTPNQTKLGEVDVSIYKNKNYKTTTKTTSYVPYERIINTKHVWLDMYPVNRVSNSYKAWEGKIGIDKKIWNNSSQKVLLNYFANFPKNIEGRYKLKKIKKSY
jgi:hypothetical protein